MVATIDRTALVGVLGAGAMGAGIAQVAAAVGHAVVVVDADAAAIERARAAIAKGLRREAEKGRIGAGEAEAAIARVAMHVGAGTGGMEAFRDCAIVIEAIVERLDAKREAFARLDEAVRGDCVLATNTSSLSISSIASACRRPERVVGAHFFNPAPVMPLVEIVPALATSPAVLAATRALVGTWGKTAVLAADTPGFIVNRVARPFYGEAIRILEEWTADAATIDWAMRELGGFRMGPFELMDFIGHDVNFAVTSSVYEGFFHDTRYRPSVTQQRLVEAGWLGRKSGRGFYDYGEDAVRPEPNRNVALGKQIVDRILVMLINEAVDAVRLRIASPADVDLAMTKGVNYPKGLLAWGRELGFDRVLTGLLRLGLEYGEDRYRPSPLLMRLARDAAWPSAIVQSSAHDE